MYNPVGCGIIIKVQETNAEHFEAAFGFQLDDCFKPEGFDCKGISCRNCDYFQKAPFHERRKNP